MREPARREVLALVESLFPGASLRALAGDASARRFYRISLADGGSRVLMDYGAPFEGETDDVVLARVFREAGLPVAAIEHEAPETGCLVLADLGDRTLESALCDAAAVRDPARIEILYTAAIDLATAVAVRGSTALARSERAAGPALDAERFRFEMDFFLEHFAGSLRGVRQSPAGLREALHALAEAASAGPSRVLCHRDFHSRNLMVLPDGSLAMVDIQDARWGPDSYDVASLLRDAYVDMDDGLAGRMLERYRRSLAVPPPAEEFAARFRVVAAERMIKVLGTFGYQAAVLGRRGYLAGVPRTLARLRESLPAAPETRAVADALERAGLLEEPGSPPTPLPGLTSPRGARG